MSAHYHSGPTNFEKVVWKNLSQIADDVEFDLIWPKLFQEKVFTRLHLDRAKAQSCNADKMVFLLCQGSSLGPEQIDKFLEVLDKDHSDVSNLIRQDLQELGSNNNNITAGAQLVDPTRSYLWPTSASVFTSSPGMHGHQAETSPVNVTIPWLGAQGYVLQDDKPLFSASPRLEAQPQDGKPPVDVSQYSGILRQSDKPPLNAWLEVQRPVPYFPSPDPSMASSEKRSNIQHLLEGLQIKGPPEAMSELGQPEFRHPPFSVNSSAGNPVQRPVGLETQPTIHPGISSQQHRLQSTRPCCDTNLNRQSVGGTPQNARSCSVTDTTLRKVQIAAQQGSSRGYQQGSSIEQGRPTVDPIYENVQIEDHSRLDQQNKLTNSEKGRPWEPNMNLAMKDTPLYCNLPAAQERVLSPQKNETRCEPKASDQIQLQLQEVSQQTSTADTSLAVNCNHVENVPQISRRGQVPSLPTISLYEEMLLRRPERVYRMDTYPRGHALIINNMHFDSLPPRNWSDKDAYNLQVMFKQLGFHVCRENNLNTAEMLECLESFKTFKNLANGSALAVCILSHGERGDLVFGADGQFVPSRGAKPGTFISKGKLLQMFKQQNCPLMKGKPKLFILQCCRGGEDDKQFDEGDSSDSSAHTPALADMCVLHSSSLGYKSYRKRNIGSPFVKFLTSLVSANAATMEFSSIFKDVQNEMRTLTFKLDGSNVVSMPEISSYMSNDWYLNPPPPESIMPHSGTK